ncbi:hypothetical protein GCM10025792_22790 [Pseudonocardia tropica]
MLRAFTANCRTNLDSGVLAPQAPQGAASAGGANIKEAPTSDIATTANAVKCLTQRFIVAPHG